MSVFKGGGNKSSINRNTGKSLVGRGINIPFSELSSQEVTEISEGITTGSIGNNASGGLTDDQDIDDSVIVGSIINNTTIGLTTASNANFTNVNILNTTPSTSSTTGAFVVSGGIGVARNSYFGAELHASEFHGCGRNITSILGENVIGNVSAEPNYLIIKVGQHCVVPPNIAPNINAVGIGSGHWLFGYNSLIAGGKNSNNYSRLSAIVAGNSQAIYNGGNLSIILGGEDNKISGEYSGVLSSISSNITGKSSLALGGNNNLVTGDNSTALGSNISISHNGSTLISDNQSFTYSSDANNQFKVRASGGSTFNSSLSVSDATTLNSSLSVTGTSSLTSEVSINSATDSTSPSIGALTVSGGIGVTKDLRVGNDISLQSSNAVLNFGLSSDVNLTHIPDTGLRLNDSRQIQFRDSTVHVSSDADGYLNLQADTGVHININGTDEILVTANETTLTGNLVIPDGGLIGSSSDQDAISISSGGVVGISTVTESSSTTTGALTVAGGVGISKDLYVGDDLFLNSDDTVLNFGADSNVNLTHIPDTGLRLNDSRQIQFRDSAIHVSSDSVGYLNLQANTGVHINVNGTDEILVTATETTLTGNLVIPDGGLIGSSSDQDTISISGAGVVGISTVTESSSITTGALTVAGGVGISKDLYLGDDLFLNSDDTVLNFGADSNVNLTHIPDTGLRLNDSRQIQFRDSAIHVSSDSDGYLNLQADTGVNLNINGSDQIAITSTKATFSGNIEIPDDYFIGSAWFSNAISISGTGNINLNSITESTSSTTGALTIKGGVGIGKDLYVGDDLFLNSDGAILNFGADSNVNLTHIPDTGLRLNDSRQIQFRDSAVHISSDVDGYLNLQADIGVNLNINGSDQISITNNESTFSGNIVIPDGSLIGTSSDLDAISISSTGVVSLSSITESNSITTGALTVAGGVGISKDLNIGDDLSLKSNGSILNFGESDDVNLTHVPSSGLLLNGSNKIQFRNSNVHISSDAAGYMNLQASNTVNININNTDEISVTSTESTFGGNLVMPDGGNFGSTSDPDAISISNTGVVTLSSTTQSSSSTIGALTVAGGVGISKKLHVGGISTFEQEIKANSTITGFKNMRLGPNHSCEIETSSILGASNSNVSTGNYSAIVAGNNHQLSSNNSIILNGDNNNNQADYSICSGYGSKTVKQGQISHAMGFFTDVGDSQFSNFIFRRNIIHVSGTTYKIGINNLEPTISSEASISIDNNSMFSYNFNLTGIATTNDKFWNFVLKGVVYRNSSGTYTHIKGTKEIIVKNKLLDDANIEVNATYGIYLIININSNYTIQWVSSLQSVENKL